MQYEIDRRLRLRVENGRLSGDQALRMQQEIERLMIENAIAVVPTHTYLHLETIARRRIPRDPNDWPTVALALALGADILTSDNDFLGRGCPTWTFETLRGELEQQR